MKHSTTRWIAVLSIGLMLLVLLAIAPPLRAPKSKPTRIQAVNNLARPFPEKSFVITNVVFTNGQTPIPAR